MKSNWQGKLDLNQRILESKSRALPLGYYPVWCLQWDSNPHFADFKSAASAYWAI